MYIYIYKHMLAPPTKYYRSEDRVAVISGEPEAMQEAGGVQSNKLIQY